VCGGASDGAVSFGERGKGWAKGGALSGNHAFRDRFSRDGPQNLSATLPQNRLSVADSGNQALTTTNSHYVGGVSFDVSPTLANVDNSVTNHTNNNAFSANPVFNVSSSGQGSGQSGAASGQGGGKQSCGKSIAKGAVEGGTSTMSWWGAAIGAVGGLLRC
jgi:hypothetical protein